MPAKRKHPRISTSYWVCCDCHVCRGEIIRDGSGKKFAFLWGMRSKRKALQDLKEHLKNHSDRCFLAKETTEEIMPTLTPQKSKTLKRKAA